MIYSVYCDDQLIYNPYLDDYYFISSNLKIVDNAIGTFSFVVDDSHVAYSAVALKRSKIKVYRDSTLFWLGRPDETQHSLDGTFSVYCSSCLSYFKDTIIRPFNFSGTPAEFFELIVGMHNDQVEEGKSFIVGECTVTDPNDYIVRSSESYEKTWEIIKSRMLDNLGGHLVITYNENDQPIISWLAEIDDYCSQDIVFGENLIDYAKGLLYDSFCTAIIPLGAELEDGSRLTVSDVNDGFDYIYDSTLVETYGYIYADVDKTTWDDVTVPTNLLLKARDWLNNNGVKYKSSVTLSAEDISVINANVDAFLPLKMVRFILSDGTILSYLITEYNCDIVYGEDLNIVLHDQETQYVSLSLGSSTARTNAENIERIKNIESNYVTGERAATITEQVLEESSIIEQRANEIIAEVVQKYLTIEAYEGYEQAILEEIATRLSTMAGELRADFTYEINEYGDSTQNKFSKIESFIRILAQTSTVNGGLVLGESTSQIKAKLENDVLYFFSGDETTVNRQNAIAYFAAGKLYVNEVQINKLTVGQTGQLMYFTIIGEGDNRCLFLSGRLV